MPNWCRDAPAGRLYGDIPDLRHNSFRKPIVFDAGDGTQGLSWVLHAGTFALGGYLRLIAVSPHAHGKGVRSALLAAYEGAVATPSLHTFLLCSAFNTDAQRFYERHGYSQVGRLPSLVVGGVDELIH